MLAAFFSGALLSIEHLVMVILGGAGAAVLANRINKLTRHVNGRISRMEKRLDELEHDEATPEP